MKLYEYCIIFNPNTTKEQIDRGETPQSKLVVDVTRVLVNSGKEAQMHAARAIPEEYVNKLEQLEIAVRPF